MENIKFIKTITDQINREGIVAGNCIYFNLSDGNKAKTWCDELGVRIKIINRIDGEVDGVYLPFENYFNPTQCSKNAPKWYQHIDCGRWYFENQYTHVLPKEDDYKRIAEAMEKYMDIYN